MRLRIKTFYSVDYVISNQQFIIQYSTNVRLLIDNVIRILHHYVEITAGYKFAMAKH